MGTVFLGPIPTTNKGKMPIQSTWSDRLVTADRLFNEWTHRFKCDHLMRYFEGFQWRERNNYGVEMYNPYTLNLFQTAMQSKLATWTMQRPQFVVNAEPGDLESFDVDAAMRSANIKQDTLNTLVRNPNMKFARNMAQAIQDSFSHFGIVETGYAKDWRNPQKQPILTRDHDDPDANPESKGGGVVDMNDLPPRERFYVKRIKPRRFRVSVTDAEDLEDMAWMGYYEYYYTRDLKNSKNIHWPKSADMVAGEYVSAELLAGGNPTNFHQTTPEALLRQEAYGVNKCWHIWDQIAKKRMLFLDTHFDEPLFEEDYERHPFTDIRWIYRTEGFYPVPLAFNWLSPQDEINEAREQTRSYRRRFTRKFQYKKNAVAPVEVEKFASGPDGVVIENTDGIGIVPIQNPDLTATTTGALVLAKDDFLTVSNNTSSMQPSDRQTATEASIHEQNSQITESAEQLNVRDFYCNTGRLLLLTMQERMEQGMWIKFAENGQDSGPIADAKVAILFKQITSQDLNDGYDGTIELEVNNETPQATQQAQQAFVQFLTIIQNFPAVAMSPVLIRYAAKVSGFRDEKVIQQYQQVALLSLAAKASAAAGQQGQTLGQAMNNTPQGANQANMLKAKISQMQPPTGEQVQTQLNNQMKATGGPG